MGTFDFVDVCTNSGNDLVSISNIIYLFLNSFVLILTDNYIIRIICTIIFMSITLLIYIPLKLHDQTEIVTKTKLAFQLLSGLLVSITLLLFSLSPSYQILGINLLVFSIPAMLSLI